MEKKVLYQTNILQKQKYIQVIVYYIATATTTTLVHITLERHFIHISAITIVAS